MLHYGSSANPFSSFMYRVTSDLFGDGFGESMASPKFGEEIPFHIEFFLNKSASLPISAPVADVPADHGLQLPPVNPVVKKKLKDVSEIEADQDMLESNGDPIDTLAFELPSPAPSSLKSRLTRIERARLLNAGFDKIFDEDGNKPVAIHLRDADTSRLTSNLDIELKDPLANEFTINFMGVTLNDIPGHTTPVTDSVYFSFQFYTFPYMTTERAKVYTGPLPPSYEKNSAHHVRSNSTPQNHTRAWSHLSQQSYATSINSPNEAIIEVPGILYRFENDGRPACILN